MTVERSFATVTAARSRNRIGMNASMSFAVMRSTGPSAFGPSFLSKLLR